MSRITAAQARWQLVLMARTLRTVARRPELGRELPRLVATRGRSTMALELPWLPFRLIDELAQLVRPGSTVFEYGGGGSTLWFLRQGAEVVTVEHHAGWAALLRQRVQDSRWTLIEKSAGADPGGYAAAITDFPDESFDLVLVDGVERPGCVREALPKVRPGGLLVVDDTDRTEYHHALASVPWPRREVVGFAPAKPSLAHTTVFTRPPTAQA